ncbi:MAG: transposase [Oscillospiraceae bacterium]|nr:transposase [Oscillospiraceae bacterium]MBQ4643018.1 transposase [Oscillospiraceae bacterium]
MNENILPKRKHPRLVYYDYSKSGYYHVTICTEGRKPILSTVGRGLAPAANKIELTAIGKIAEEQLLFLESEYSFVKIDRYVIMPNHIHVIFILFGKTAGASPRPTLSDIVCAYKSRTTRLCNKFDLSPGRKIFQASFYDEIIRNQSAYDEISKYIFENPMKWEEDELYYIK